MKVTIEIPDELYRKVEAKSARQGRPLDAVIVELLERWLDEDAPEPRHSPDEALEAWLRLGEEVSRNASPGPTSTEILEADRDRLERR